jgi:hypothetical protein
MGDHARRAFRPEIAVRQEDAVHAGVPEMPHSRFDVSLILDQSIGEHPFEVDEADAPFSELALKELFVPYGVFIAEDELADGA